MGVVSMKRTLLIMFCLSLILLPMHANPWKGGIDTRISGFSVLGVSERDMIGLRAAWMPYSSETITTNISAGILASNPFLSSQEFNLDASATLSILLSKEHPLSNRMARDSHWYAQIETGYFAGMDSLNRGIVYASVAPFTLFFGDKMISAGSPMLLWNTEEQSFGWGVTLLKITHYYW
jgi:hypothetical protein